MRVLVAGGGGVLGRQLIQELLARKHQVTSFAYSEREFAGLQHPDLKTFACDVTRPEQLRGVCEGIDIVISCIGITRLSGRLTHLDVDYQGNLNLLLEAKRAGVGKVSFISPKGVDEGYREAPLLEAKHLFEEALKQSGLPWVIFHAGGFFGDLKEMGKAAAKGCMFVFGRGENRFTPVDVSDLARIMVADTLSRENAVVSVGGPEDLSWNDICRACFAQHGRPPKILHIPLWVGRLTLMLLKPFSRKYDAMGRLILFMCTHDLLTEKRGSKSLAQYLRESA